MPYSTALEPTIPLSWSSSKSGRAAGLRLYRVPLKAGSYFVPFARVKMMSQQEFINQLGRELTSASLVLRGVSERLAKALPLSEYHIWQFGSEARLQLDQRVSKSLFELERRAARFGTFVVSQSFPEDFSTSQGSLKGLFLRQRTAIALIASYQKDSAILAQVTVSLRERGHYHIETLWRDEHAPNGAIEGLILALKRYLQKEKFAQTLSLGEVPCVVSGNCGLMTQVSNQAGKLLLKRSYGVAGLFQFKDKFSPDWIPTYWIVPRVKALRSFAEVLHLTGTTQLLLTKKKRF